MAQLVASMSGVVLGGVVEVVGSNLARGRVFTALISSSDSLYPSVYIYITALPEHPIFGDVSVAQLVASMSGVVLGGVAMVVGSNLARGKKFTASFASVDSLYLPILIYCMNLHQFLILRSSKAMMFVKLYFRF